MCDFKIQAYHRRLSLYKCINAIQNVQVDTLYIQIRREDEGIIKQCKNTNLLTGDGKQKTKK